MTPSHSIALADIATVGPDSTRHLHAVRECGASGAQAPRELVVKALPVVPGEAGTADPMIGYLVLAPAGTQPSELFSPAVTVTEAEPSREPPVAFSAQPGQSALSVQQVQPVLSAQLVRPAQETQPAEQPGPGPAGIHVDGVRRTVTVDGRLLSLTYMEFELLAHFVKNPNQVYTRRQLVSAVWGYGYQHVGDGRTVDVHIARVRRKLGPAHRKSIVTIRRVGYKYVPAP